MIYASLITMLFIARSLSAPVDEPIRIDLPVYSQPEEETKVKLAQPLEPENYPSLDSQSGQSIVGNLITQKLQTVNSVFESKANAVNVAGGIFSAPVTMREDALLETEGLGSQVLSAKENVQNIVAGLFQPKPIVDTIREEDKYGNAGDKFASAGQAIVNGAEGISNFVNSVLEVPQAIFRKITRAASEKLNNLGGRLIGL